MGRIMAQSHSKEAEAGYGERTGGAEELGGSVDTLGSV